MILWRLDEFTHDAFRGLTSYGVEIEGTAVTVSGVLSTLARAIWKYVPMFSIFFFITSLVSGCRRRLGKQTFSD